MSRREFAAKVKVAAFERAGYLGDRLAYDPRAGELRWLPRPRSDFSSDRAWKAFNCRDAGTVAGSLSKVGYVTIRIDGRLFYAHRVAWVLAYGGPIPDGYVIDHVNGVKSDNRLRNLRLATRGQNGHNQRRRQGKRLPKGIHFDRSRQRFMAYVDVDGHRHYAGRFDSLDDAAEAVRALRTRLHGNFCNHGDSDAA